MWVNFFWINDALQKIHTQINFFSHIQIECWNVIYHLELIGYTTHLIPIAGKTHLKWKIYWARSRIMQLIARGLSLSEVILDNSKHFGAIKTRDKAKHKDVIHHLILITALNYTLEMLHNDTLGENLILMSIWVCLLFMLVHSKIGIFTDSHVKSRPSQRASFAPLPSSHINSKCWQPNSQSSQILCCFCCRLSEGIHNKSGEAKILTLSHSTILALAPCCCIKRTVGPPQSK